MSGEGFLDSVAKVVAVPVCNDCAECALAAAISDDFLGECTLDAVTAHSCRHR
jgi:hypothetical protein